LELGQNPKTRSVGMSRVTAKEITEHEIRPTKEIPITHHTARCARLLIIIYSLRNVLKKVQAKREKRIMDRRMIFVLMYVLSE